MIMKFRDLLSKVIHFKNDGKKTDNKDRIANQYEQELLEQKMAMLIGKNEQSE